MNFARYKAVRRLARYGILVALFVVTLLSILTYYGQNSGNFVMTVDKQAYDKGVVLAETSEFETENRWLTAAPVDNVRDISIPNIAFEDIVQNNGAYLDNYSNYLAYTFYVKNIGKEVTPIYYKIDIPTDTQNMSKSVRVALIIDGKMVNRDGEDVLDYTSFIIYKAKDTVDVTYPSYYDKYTIREFESDKVVCNDRIDDLRPGYIKKVSIIMWVEGEDPECTKALFGAKIKLSLTFNVKE